MELHEAVRTQGTCRYFRRDPVPHEVMARALDHARFAPSGGNRQPVRFVVVEDEAKRKRLAEWYIPLWRDYIGGLDLSTAPPAARNANHFAEHLHEVPAIVVVCAKLSDVLPTDAHLGRLSVVGGCSIYPAVQNFLLGCRAEGLGTALTTLLCRSEPQVKQLLSLPDDISTVAHIAVGYPDRPFPTRLSRRPLSSIAFLDTHGSPFV